MKFTINREIFLKALINTCRLQQNIKDPILSSIKLELDEEKLLLTASNGIISILYTIPKYIDDKVIIRNIESGSILISQKMIFEIVRRIEGEEINFSVEEENLVRIQTMTSSFNINVQRASEYRELDFELSGTKVRVLKDDFINMINQVSFSASTKETRPVLTAINLECNGESLIFTATDGARLSKKEIPVESSQKFTINIPSKSLVESIKSFEDEKFIELYINERKLLIKFNNSIFSTTLVAGDYPNMKNVVPKNLSFFLTVNSTEFLKTIDRVVLFSPEKENIVKLTMREEDVVISSRSQQIGDAKEHLQLFKYEGERLEISFDVNYVIPAIRALRSEDVTLAFMGEMKPFTITTKKDNSIIQLITPVRSY